MKKKSQTNKFNFWHWILPKKTCISPIDLVKHFPLESLSVLTVW